MCTDQRSFTSEYVIHKQAFTCVQDQSWENPEMGTNENLNLL